MAETSTAPPQGKSKNKLVQFIKKNKTLSAVIGIGGGYFLMKQLGNGGGGESEETVEAGPGGGGFNGQEVVEARQESHEAIDQEISRVENELREEREDRERMEEERSGKDGNEQKDSPDGGDTEESSNPSQSGPGIYIHGRFFAGATGSHITKTGELGKKPYIEYAIRFPGRVEHWQYFTHSGNWRQVSNSATGPGSGNPPKPPKNKPPKPPKNKPAKNKPPKVSPNQPVNNPPAKDPSHPNAVNTGNKCVNGGVGGHKAPKGYHLYCKNGWIWRAPN